MHILVLYDTYHGHTAAMAQEIAAGASEVRDAEVRLKQVVDAVADDLLWADGIALGSPTHMGSMGWQMKRFIDDVFASLWGRARLSGKVGAVFTTGGSGGAGGAELTLLALMANLAQQGMILLTHPHNVPGYRPDGISWGPTWSTGRGDLPPTEAQVAAARGHGRRLAELSGRVAAGGAPG